MSYNTIELLLHMNVETLIYLSIITEWFILFHRVGYVRNIKWRIYDTGAHIDRQVVHQLIIIKTIWIGSDYKQMRYRMLCQHPFTLFTTNIWLSCQAATNVLVPHINPTSSRFENFICCTACNWNLPSGAYTSQKLSLKIIAHLVGKMHQ